MKVKITDFLVTMGNICHERKECNGCIFDFVDEEHRAGCARDFLYDEQIAEKVRRIVLEQMKGGGNNVGTD